MTWKKIVSIYIFFLKKENNNIPIYITGVLAENLSFCRGVDGGITIFVYISLTFFLINIFSPFQIYQKPNEFIIKYRDSSLEKSTMGSGNFTTKCLILESSFFRPNLYVYSWVPIFVSRKYLVSKVEMGPGPFYKVVSLQNYP